MNDLMRGSVWYRRGHPFTDSLCHVSAHMNHLHADGDVVADDDEPSTENEIWRVRESSSGLLHLEIHAHAIPSAPPVWFVFVPEPSATPAAVNLVAYPADVTPSSPGSKNAVPPAGTVISANRFPVLGVANDAQVAAIRWYPRDGLIHQVFVRQDARRQSLGTVMIYAASAVHQAHAWPGRIHGDGRRTDLGDKFVAGLRHPHRYAPLSDMQPPMDPS